LLLAVPLTLVAVERLRRPDERVHAHDRLLTLVMAGLYLWLLVNPGLARASGVNASVAFLAAVAGLLINRACREHVSATVGQEEIEALPKYHLPQPMRTAA